MKKLVIYGATCPDFLRSLRHLADRFEFLGYIDDDPSTHGTSPFAYPVLGGSDILKESQFEDVYFSSMVGSSTKARKAVHQKVVNAGRHWTNLVHPGVDLSDVNLGVGTVLHEGVILCPGVRLGDGCLVNFGTIIGHETIIQNYLCTGINVTFNGRIKVEDEVYIGSGAVIQGNLTLGHGCTIGSGAVVTRDVEPGSTVVGVPARPFRPV